uniref:RxLR effector protein n=1 Tax=Phytophthora agathidicida TaxID=1642459 RepID=A0A7G4WI08_9STRA|nr:PaRXLR19 [Phytophthora agathidicida]
MRLSNVFLLVGASLAAINFLVVESAQTTSSSKMAPPGLLEALDAGEKNVGGRKRLLRTQMDDEERAWGLAKLDDLLSDSSLLNSKFELWKNKGRKAAYITSKIKGITNEEKYSRISLEYAKYNGELKGFVLPTVRYTS